MKYSIQKIIYSTDLPKNISNVQFVKKSNIDSIDYNRLNQHSKIEIENTHTTVRLGQRLVKIKIRIDFYLSQIRVRFFHTVFIRLSIFHLRFSPPYNNEWESRRRTILEKRGPDHQSTLRLGQWRPPWAWGRLWRQPWPPWWCSSWWFARTCKFRRRGSSTAIKMEILRRESDMGLVWFFVCFYAYNVFFCSVWKKYFVRLFDEWIFFILKCLIRHDLCVFSEFCNQAFFVIWKRMWYCILFINNRVWISKAFFPIEFHTRFF